jgi:hypothetical protein
LQADVSRFEWQQKRKRTTYQLNFADHAAIYFLPQPTGARVMRPEKAVHQGHTFSSAHRHHLPGFFGIRGDWLLAQHMLSRFRGTNRPGSVQTVG